ncbi:hypothetical protein [Yersinia pseudotuberculosis]|uniref:hypothetical protein n=1 Tax=Yersinia pseudotuberculosis TaxID=633 RepID=UPI0005E18226|nr:hypothetical protein [Yersinia pseudotuberculosis]CFV22102.1 Uncharacterised protein [Yersinia pseudotuberculosis]
MIAEGSNIDAEARKVIEQANFNMLRIIAQLATIKLEPGPEAYMIERAIELAKHEHTKIESYLISLLEF